MTALTAHLDGPPRGRSVAIRLGLLSLGVATALLAVSAGWLSVAGAVLVCAVLLVAWVVAVLGAEMERLIAVVLLPVALVVGTGAAGWVLVVQPQLDRASAQVTEFQGQVDKLTGLLSSIPSVGSTAGGLVDRVKQAANAATQAGGAK